jgi:Flp pilus assembly CpaF family ATPase
MWDCLKASMRLIPTRIVIGEVRDVAAHVMLWRGIPGIPAASRAFMPIARSKRYFGLNDAFSIPGREGVHTPLSHASVRPEIARVVNLVLFFEGDDEFPAGRKLREVLLVKGYDPDTDTYDCEYV